MSKHSHPTPNDQRSTVKNPTSPQYAQDQANQSQQSHSIAVTTPASAPNTATTSK